MPYENSVIYIAEIDEKWRINAVVYGDDYSVKMAEYATKEEAVETMERLRNHYGHVDVFSFARD